MKKGQYKVVQEKFKAPNGAERSFRYRENTNDRDIILSVFCADKYGILDLEFEKEDTVLDIGAHIGAATILLSTMRPDLRVFAYEPMTENFELLKKNVMGLTEFQEVNIFNEAVWCFEDDRAKLYYGVNTPPGRFQKFIGSFFPDGVIYDKRVFKVVDSTSLSELFKDNRIFHCRFMKLSVEGAEFGIFKCAPKEVLEMIDRVHGEYYNIEPKLMKKPREILLKQTKGVYIDVTGQPAQGRVGLFKFARK